MEVIKKTEKVRKWHKNARTGSITEEFHGWNFQDALCKTRRWLPMAEGKIFRGDFLSKTHPFNDGIHWKRHHMLLIWCRIPPITAYHSYMYVPMASCNLDHNPMEKWTDLRSTGSMHFFVTTNSYHQ
jgi:hypothetical protein